MTVIRETAYRKMAEYCRGELPCEACGLLAGVKKEGQGYIEEVYFLSNVDRSARHFSMAPEEQFYAIRDMREKGYELLGNFHSHPRSGPIPSREDIRLAYDANLLYLILSLMGNKPQLKAYRIDRERNVILESILEISGPEKKESLPDSP